MGIALVGENGGAMGVMGSGINNMQAEHNKCEIYINGENMVAGPEENKRQDFTVNSIQGWELTMTKFECRTWCPGISEVMWGGGIGYWNPEWARNLSV